MKYPKVVFNDITKRMVAFIIDLIMIKMIRKIIFLIFPMVVSSGDFISKYYLIKMGVFLAYFTISVGVTKGYTIGKAIMGLKVVPLDSDTLSWPTVLIRELVMGFVHYQWSWLYIIVLFSEYNQSLADMLADTGVISERYLSDLEEYADKNTEDQDNYQIHVDNL